MTGSRYHPWDRDLVPGVLVRRYKRFLADVELEDGRMVTAHCPNPGSMLGMAEPGIPVRLLPVDDPRRKLPWTWELVRPAGDAWVAVNTMRANAVAAWAIGQGVVPGVERDVALRREVPYGVGSRVDFVASRAGEAGGRDTFIEVKSTTLADGGVARFPDAVTARGTRHMQELAAVVEAGHDAMVLFLVNRGDCDRFEPAADIDPAYAEALRAAVDAGVQAVALGTSVDETGWAVRGPLPVNVR